MSPHLVLVGQMASGKTTVGRLLARRLGRPFLDSDEYVARRSGLTAAEYLAGHGLEALHRIENEHLLHALTSPVPGVVAAAAATVDTALIRELLRSHQVVWLRTSVATLVERTESDPLRPIVGGTAEYLERLYRRRRGIFSGIASIGIDTGGQYPDRIAARIAAHAGGR